MLTLWKCKAIKQSWPNFSSIGTDSTNRPNYLTTLRSIGSNDEQSFCRLSTFRASTMTLHTGKCEVRSLSPTRKRILSIEGHKTQWINWIVDYYQYEIKMNVELRYDMNQIDTSGEDEWMIYT